MSAAAPTVSRRNSRLLLLLFIAAFGFFLRFKAADHAYISQWDEAYHALVAKNLVRHPLVPTLDDAPLFAGSGTGWTQAHVWLHKPPLPLWLMAASWSVFGPAELSFRLPSVLLDTAVVVILFFLSLELFGGLGAGAGLIASASYALNPLMIRLVSGRVPDDHAHVINVFFIVLTACLFVRAAKNGRRAWAACAGASLGLGTLCMSAVALFGLAAALPLIVARLGARRAGPLLAASAAAFAATAAPWPLYCFVRWPDLWRQASADQAAHLFAVLEGHAHAPGWYVGLLPLHYGGCAALDYLLAASALAAAAWTAVRRKDAALGVPLAWALLTYGFFTAIPTKLYSYVCVGVPALSLLTGWALAYAWSLRRRGRALQALGWAAAAAWTAQTVLVARERLAADYRVCPWNALYDYPSFRAALLRIGAGPGPKVVFNVGDMKSPQAMYYAGCSAYPSPPSVEALRRVLGRGYRVYFLAGEDGRGADALAAYRAAGLLNRVEVVELPRPRETIGRHPYES